MNGLPALRQYRQSQGLSQQELAKKLGVTATTVYRWEAGRREPRGAVRGKISEITGIPFHLLVQQPNEAAE